jgi:hydroxyacylglutathione hydrolase
MTQERDSGPNSTELAIELIPHRIWLLAGGDEQHLIGDPDDCNVYAIRSSQGVLLVDSGIGRDPDGIPRAILAAGLDPKSLVAVLLTHTHLDHSGGAAHLQEKFGAEVFASPEAVERLRVADEDSISLPVARRVGMYRPDDRFRPTRATPVEAGTVLEWGDVTAEVLATPGHASDHLAFLIRVDALSILFSGDLLFPRGRVFLLSTPDASLQALIRSLNQLRGVDIDALCPGHSAPVVDPQAARDGVALAHSRLDSLAIPDLVEFSSTPETPS